MDIQDERKNLLNKLQADPLKVRRRSSICSFFFDEPTNNGLNNNHIYKDTTPTDLNKNSLGNLSSAKLPTTDIPKPSLKKKISQVFSVPNLGIKDRSISSSKNSVSHSSFFSHIHPSLNVKTPAFINTKTTRNNDSSILQKDIVSTSKVQQPVTPKVHSRHASTSSCSSAESSVFDDTTSPNRNILANYDKKSIIREGTSSCSSNDILASPISENFEMEFENNQHKSKSQNTLGSPIVFARNDISKSSEYKEYLSTESNLGSEGIVPDLEWLQHCLLIEKRKEWYRNRFHYHQRQGETSELPWGKNTTTTTTTNDKLKQTCVSCMRFNVSTNNTCNDTSKSSGNNMCTTCIENKHKFLNQCPYCDSVPDETTMYKTFFVWCTKKYQYRKTPLIKCPCCYRSYKMSNFDCFNWSSMMQMVMVVQERCLSCFAEYSTGTTTNTTSSGGSGVETHRNPVNFYAPGLNNNTSICTKCHSDFDKYIMNCETCYYVFDLKCIENCQLYTFKSKTSQSTTTNTRDNNNIDQNLGKDTNFCVQCPFCTSYTSVPSNSPALDVLLHPY